MKRVLFSILMKHKKLYFTSIYDCVSLYTHWCQQNKQYLEFQPYACKVIPHANRHKTICCIFNSWNLSNLPKCTFSLYQEGFVVMTHGLHVTLIICYSVCELGLNKPLGVNAWILIFLIDQLEEFSRWTLLCLKVKQVLLHNVANFADYRHLTLGGAIDIDIKCMHHTSEKQIRGLSETIHIHHIHCHINVRQTIHRH